MDYGYALLLQERSSEVLVGLDLLAIPRGSADHASAGRIDVESALGRRAVQTLRLVQHGDDEVAPVLEGRDPLLEEPLRAFQSLDRGPLADRARVRSRLRLQCGD